GALAWSFVQAASVTRTATMRMRMGGFSSSIGKPCTRIIGINGATIGPHRDHLPAIERQNLPSAPPVLVVSLVWRAWTAVRCHGTTSTVFRFCLTALARGALAAHMSEPLPSAATARGAHLLKTGAYT